MAQAKTKTDRRTKDDLLEALGAEEARTAALRTRLSDAESKAGAAERNLQDEKRRNEALRGQLDTANNNNAVLEGRLEEARRAAKKLTKKVFESLDNR